MGEHRTEARRGEDVLDRLRNSFCSRAVTASTSRPPSGVAEGRVDAALSSTKWTWLWCGCWREEEGETSDGESVMVGKGWWCVGESESSMQNTSSMRRIVGKGAKEEQIERRG